MLGRHYIGIEREPEYLEIARKRLEGVEFAGADSQRDTAVGSSQRRQGTRLPFL
jgi:DNA modification methylase